MSPVPPNTSASLYVDYTGPFSSHTIKFDFGSATTPANAVTKVTPVLNAMKPLLYNGASFNAARWRPAGSSVSITIAWTPITSASGTNKGAASAPGTFLQWGGRAASGVRVKWYLFETYLPYTNDMRYNNGDDAGVDAVTTALIAAVAGSDPVTAADMTAPSLYTYANIGQNDYWTHKAR